MDSYPGPQDFRIWRFDSDDYSVLHFGCPCEPYDLHVVQNLRTFYSGKIIASEYSVVFLTKCQPILEHQILPICHSCCRDIHKVFLDICTLRVTVQCAPFPKPNQEVLAPKTNHSVSKGKVNRAQTCHLWHFWIIFLVKIFVYCAMVQCDRQKTQGGNNTQKN